MQEKGNLRTYLVARLCVLSILAISSIDWGAQRPSKFFCCFMIDGGAFASLLVAFYVGIPSCIIFYCYFRIFKTIRTHNNNLYHPGNGINTVNIKEIKVARTLFVIVVFYSLCSAHNLHKQLKLYIFQAPSDSLYKLCNSFNFLFSVSCTSVLWGVFSMHTPLWCTHSY